MSVLALLLVAFLLNLQVLSDLRFHILVGLSLGLADDLLVLGVLLDVVYGLAQDLGLLVRLNLRR